MSNPAVVTNVVPVQGEVASVTSGIHFGVRSASTDVDRSTIQCRFGIAPVFYDGQVLPENRTDYTFSLESFIGSPGPAADCEMGSQQELVITNQAGTQRSTYFFGGLQAPALPTDELMVEATVKVVPAEVTTYDSDGFTGVSFGLLTGTTGVSIRLRKNGGGTRYIDAWSADPGAVAAIYTAAYDWSNWSTFKLLWDPSHNIFRLYVSSGSASTPDTTLLTGTVTAFPDLSSAALALHSTPPWAFFGNISTVAVASSHWQFVGLYNETRSPVQNGIVTGAFDGFLSTDEATIYTPTSMPDTAGQAWCPLPDTFTAGGAAYLESNKLVLESSPGKSIGYCRAEPKVGVNTVLDFVVSATVLSPVPGSDTSCFEFYIDDGVKSARLAFLQDKFGSQYVGILRNLAQAEQLVSYETYQMGFTAPLWYRMILSPTNGLTVWLVTVSNEGGYLPTMILELPYFDLPATSMPGPGVGFLHNGSVAQVSSKMWIQGVRYSTSVVELETTDIQASLPSGWATTGTGVVTPALGGRDYAGISGQLALQYGFSIVYPKTGINLEFRARVSDWATSGDSPTDQPLRSLSGFQVSMMDDTYATTLLFADAGSLLGRIVFLQTMADQNQNLQLIIAGDPSVAGTYARVDWTQFNLYRLHSVPYGRITLSLNTDTTPRIDMDENLWLLPSSGGTSQFLFGNSNAGMTTSVDIGHILLGLSSGFDVSLTPQMTSGDVQAFFGSSVNCIVEAFEVS